MNIKNLEQTPEEKRVSPKGKYHVRQKNLSLNLGGVKDGRPWEGGHPFDVCEVRIPPGKTNWPMHSHTQQWEFFLIQSGKGVVRTPKGDIKITSGDYFIHPPLSSHQVINQGKEDLVMLVVANNPTSDLIRYFKTGKFFLKPSRVMFSKEGRATDYYDGEE